MAERMILDGGSGTMLQASGLPAGKDPADWNVENPGAVAAVHRAYVEAGASVILTNTFGVNSLKYGGTYALAELVAGALRIARACTEKPHRVALDIGPTGRLLAPAGDLDFDEAVRAFAETVRLAVSDLALKPDLVFIETMGDIRELKAAVLAAKENCDLPIWATVALGEDGKLLTGGSVEGVAALLESLGVAAYGFNCGLGPDRMEQFVRRLAAVSTKPIIVKPNAGMPVLEGGRTVFRVGPREFAEDVRRLVAAGASVVGGCCGTTPEHIRVVAEVVTAMEAAGDAGNRAVERPDSRRTVISSGSEVVELLPGAGLIIGERINPTGKKWLKEAYRVGDWAAVLREAVAQTEAGAVMLDVNCGVPGIDEPATLDRAVQAVQSVVTCPIQIDTADPAALERALRHVNGRPLVNSVNGTVASMNAVFPLVRRFGGALVALCLDEAGIPPTVEGRLAIARRILCEGAKYGFQKQDFVFDALTLAVSADAQAAVVTLETVRRLTEELGVNTILGVSNVSFGLPNRPALNNTMYALARRAGLSAAIANPTAIRDEIDPAAEAVLLGRDANCAAWIASASSVSAPTPSVRVDVAPTVEGVANAVRRGLEEDAGRIAAQLLANATEPMEIVTGAIVPALEDVGRGFEAGRLFLPQLLLAANAAGAAFGAVKEFLGRQAGTPASTIRTPDGTMGTPDGTMGTPGGQRTRPIVLATVKGDIHDIGKNIVRALLENFGFAVIDLGRDVAPEAVVEAARKSNAFLIGLSALMTTTVGAMAETVRLVRAAGLDAKTVVGGAVVTEDYAKSIGADFYAADAMRTVRYAEALRQKLSPQTVRI